MTGATNTCGFPSGNPSDYFFCNPTYSACCLSEDPDLCCNF
ncbi:MAG: hypothetical protein U0821_00055 [Chloroflexota bacterium]